MTGRLDTLLRVREIEERRRAGEVAAAEQARRVAVAAEGHARDRLRGWTAPTGREVGVDQVVGARLEALALHDAVGDAQGRTAVATTARTTAEQTWSRARIRLRSVERLAEQRAEAERVERERRAQADADEMALQARSRRTRA